MGRAPSNGRILNNADAAYVKAMIRRGDRQHDIAAYFAVNGGRIGETSTGQNFAAVSPSAGPLPPAAPYIVLPASLRNDADQLMKEVQAAGMGSDTVDRVTRIISAMEQSRIFRRGK